MGSGGSLGAALFCWVLVEVASYSPWGLPQRDSAVLRVRGDSSWSRPRVPSFSQPSPWAWVDVSQLQAAAPLHPVAVQCQEAQVVVTVHRDLFGTGRLVKAVDLTLGSAACLPLAQDVAESVVTFVVGLHECGSILQVRWDTGVRGFSILAWVMDFPWAFTSTGWGNENYCGHFNCYRAMCSCVA